MLCLRSRFWGEESRQIRSLERLASSVSLWKSLDDLCASARSKPEGLAYGTAGVGSIGHLATVMLSDAAKVRMVHVPYKGAANAAQDLAGGRIDVMVSNYSTLAPLMQKDGGRVRALGVTSQQAHPSFVGLPPLAATVPGYAMDIWIGVFAPAGTPAPLVERLNREITAISTSPALATVLGPDGTLPNAMNASAFAARVKEELTKWKQLAATHKIVAE